MSGGSPIFAPTGGLMEFPNIVLESGKAMPYADIAQQLQASAVTWDDIPWIRDAWHGPIVIKGVHSVEDAQRAVECGAEALVISNHGGRQLDQGCSTLEVLRDVAPARQGCERRDLDGRRHSFGIGCPDGAGNRGQSRPDWPRVRLWTWSRRKRA